MSHICICLQPMRLYQINVKPFENWVDRDINCFFFIECYSVKKKKKKLKGLE